MYAEGMDIISPIFKALYEIARLVRTLVTVHGVYIGHDFQEGRKQASAKATTQAERRLEICGGS